MTSKLYPSLFMDKFTALDRLISAMRKPCVNQVWACANQNQPCVNFFSSYANPEISAIPKYFAKPCWFGAYFDVLIMCHTFRVQSGKVTFWGQKKFTQVYTVYTGLPPDASSLPLRHGADAVHWHDDVSTCSPRVTYTVCNAYAQHTKANWSHSSYNVHAMENKK